MAKPTTSTTTPPQPKVSDEDITAAFNRFQAEAASRFIDTSDPDVYTGGDWSADAWGRSWLDVPGLTKKLSQVKVDFYRLEPDELRRFQEDAFQAGFYGNAKREDIPFGDYDEATSKIWETLASRSASFLQAGKRKSLWDALSDAKKSAPAAITPTREPLVIRLTNPDDLRAVVGKVASDITGGKTTLNPTQLEDYINQIHDAERAAQRTDYQLRGSGAPGGPGGELTQPGDASVAARSTIFAAQPEAAHQYSYIESFNTFMNLLRSSGL